MAVYQCPECDLRFPFESDLDDHLRQDHPEFHADPKSDVDRVSQELRRGRRHHPPRSRSRPESSP